MTDTRPTARALRALELISTRPGITAEELGERLGVTERAARRYVSLLREAEIPVESIRGPYGGYRIGRGLRLPPLTFTDDEALALVMAALDAHHSARGEDPVGTALGKILRALPQGVAKRAAVVREHAASVAERSPVRPDPAILAALTAAAADRHQVEINYRSESGRQLHTTVDPWAVVVRHSRWYLLCFSHVADAVRTYRIDRVVAASTLPGRFTPPADLDPATALDEHLGAGWEFETRVVFDAPHRGGPAVRPQPHGPPGATRRRHPPDGLHQQSRLLRRSVARDHPVAVPRRGRAGAASRGD